jgi:hypothetical protein
MATSAGHRLILDHMGKCSNAFYSETTNMIKAVFTVREYLLQTVTNVPCLSEAISGPFFIYDLSHKC